MQQIRYVDKLVDELARGKAMDNTRVFRMAFASVYPHYIKAEMNGRTKEQVHAIIHRLTGYDEQALQQQIDKKADFELRRSRELTRLYLPKVTH